MKVLSLFDGMSCGMIALDRLGIKVDKYYASEIDKYAIQVSQANYPNIIQIGDVCDIKAEDYQDIDLILAGSPCQGFSFAGKQLAFDDPRSALFFEFIRLLKEIKPKYFLLENVNMKKEFLDVISEQVSSCYPELPFGIERIKINSALVSAQNRVRWYWTNIPGVDQPEQRGIVLRDILEYQLEDNTNAIPNKSQTIKSQYYKSSKANFERSGTFHATGIPQKSKEQYIETHDTPKQIATAIDVNGHDILKRVYSEDGKSPVVTTCGGGNTEPKVVAGAWRGRSLDENGKNVAWKETKPKQMLELRKDEKSNSLTSVGKDNLVVQSYREVRTEEAKRLRRESKKNTGKDHTPFRAKKIVPREDGKVGTVTPGLNNDHMISLTRDKDQDVYWRKLSPRECERLQTVPDDYTNSVSNTQRYKMLGNGWTIEVICHILKNMDV
jgi:DNA-cytosine methyltransferase